MPGFREAPAVVRVAASGCPMTSTRWPARSDILMDPTFAGSSTTMVKVDWKGLGDILIAPSGVPDEVSVNGAFWPVLIVLRVIAVVKPVVFNVHCWASLLL